MERRLFTELLLSQATLVAILLALWNQMRWTATYLRSVGDANASRMQYYTQGALIPLWFAFALVWRILVQTAQLHLGQDPTQPTHFWGMIRLLGFAPGLVVAVRFVLGRSALRRRGE